MLVGLRRKWGPLLAANRKAGLLLLSAVWLVAGFSFATRHAGAGEEPAHDLFYASFYVFVPSGNTPSVSLINKSTDEMIGRIVLPMVPRQIVVSEAVHLLAAIDGTSSRIVLVDLVSGKQREVDPGFPAQKLWLSGDATLLAAVDLAGGKIAFVDLVHRRARSQVSVAGPIRDLLFSADDKNLFFAADGLDGIGVIDVARGQSLAPIPAFSPGGAIITGLTRSPDGLVSYAVGDGGRAIRFEQPQDWPPGAIDGRAGAAATEPAEAGPYLVAPIEVATDVGKLFPTGYGKYLVALDNGSGTVTLAATASAKPVATLHGLAAMSTVYSGWFDAVSIVASATEARLLVVDLDRLDVAGAIDLPGVPGSGSVTDDGSKLYVPIGAADAVAVIDLRNRRLSKIIPVAAAPSAAVMTRSFDICH